MVLFLAGVQAVQLGWILRYYITPSQFSANLIQLSLSLSLSSILSQFFSHIDFYQNSRYYSDILHSFAPGAFTQHNQ